MKIELLEQPPAAGQAQSTLNIDDAKHRRWGWWALLLGFGGFMAWATLAPLDQGVAAPGTVIVSGNRKAVQPLVGGLVKSILVKEGDPVRAGQVLVQLDPTQATAQLESARGQLYVTQAIEARLEAERLGKPDIAYPEALRAAAKTDVRAAEAMPLQSQLFQSRRRTLQSELAVLDESIAGLEEQAKGLEAVRDAKQTQLKFLTEELKGQRELAAEGYLPRNRLLEQERALAQLTGALSEDIGNIGRTRRSIAELKMRALARQQEYRKEVESQLTDVGKELNTLSNRVRALSFEAANMEIRSPADGVTVGLAIHTVGGVVQTGATLMEVVPGDEPLKIDARIDTALIDKVRPGLPVDILFPAFSQSTTPHVAGEVLTVSADILTDPKTGTPYYKALIQVTPDGMRHLKAHEIKAGMPAQAFIRTGERTLLNYLFKPLRDRLRSALTEQ
jgi:protease secretion system membrane fusion protein